MDDLSLLGGVSIPEPAGLSDRPTDHAIHVSGMDLYSGMTPHLPNSVGGATMDDDGGVTPALTGDAGILEGSGESSAQTILDAWLHQLQTEEQSEEPVVENRLDIDSIFSNDLEFDMDFLAELAKPGQGGDSSVSLHELSQDPDLGLLCPTGLETADDLGPFAPDQLFTENAQLGSSDTGKGGASDPDPVSVTDSKKRESPEPEEDPLGLTTTPQPVASISVVTNKRQDKTIITISTPKGRQSFVLPTADLAQASRVLRALQKKRTGEQDKAAGASIEPGRRGSKRTSKLLSMKRKRLAIEAALLKKQMSESDTIYPDNDDPVMKAALRQLNVDLSNVQVVDMIKPGGKRNSLYRCPLSQCDETFPIIHGLKVHILRHFNHKPYKCPEFGCKWEFFELGKLNRHMSTHKKAELKCGVRGCSGAFRNKTNRQRHWRQVHSPEETRAAQIALQNAEGTEEEADEEEGSGGDQEKPPATFPCAHCGREFRRVVDQKRHEKTHPVAGTDLQCHERGCAFTAETLSQLKLHQRKHSERTYKCTFPECFWAFRDHAKLKRHLTMHTGRRGFQCPYAGCSKSYGRMDSLSAHVRLHMGRYYHCPVSDCSLRFTQKYALASHMRQVHGLVESAVPVAASGAEPAAPLLCPVCGAQFRSELYRLIHLQDVHGTPQKSSDANPAVAQRKAVKQNVQRRRKTQQQKIHSKNLGRNQCRVCGMQFAAESSLLTHIKQRHGDSQLRVNGYSPLGDVTGSKPQKKASRFNPESLNWVEDGDPLAMVDGEDPRMSVYMPFEVETEGGPSEVLVRCDVTGDECRELGMGVEGGAPVPELGISLPAGTETAAGSKLGKRTVNSSTRDVVRQLRKLGVGAVPVGMKRIAEGGCARTDIISCHLARLRPTKSEQQCRQACDSIHLCVGPNHELIQLPCNGAVAGSSLVASSVAMDPVSFLCESDGLGCAVETMPHSTINLSDLS